MSEEKSAGIKKTVSGWIKAAITSVIGLISGAFIMYLTPVVNNAIKPAKPVANFATMVNGLSVEVNNRSTGAVQGWWDFGDGSALEPFDPKAENVKHVFPKPGTYTVKLSLQNLLGEASDRSASVVLDADSVPRPEFESFKLLPYSASDRAPVTFRLVSKVKNATHAILSVGDNRPTEVMDDANQDRFITFNEMGSYTVRFAAINGKQLVEKSETVFVSPNDGGEAVARLAVTYEAVRVERIERDVRIYCGWQGDTKESVSAVRKERPVDPDCKIVSVVLTNRNEKNAHTRKFEVQASPDNSKIIVTGELVKPSGLLTPKTAPPYWVAQVKVVMERRSKPEVIDRGDVMMAVRLNGATPIPMQPLGPGYEILRKQVNLQLWDGGRKVWEGSKPVSNAKVVLKNQVWQVTATPQNDSMLLKIDGGSIGAAPIPTLLPTPPVGPVIRPAAFERNPLLPKRK